VCLDGTWNTADHESKITNVVRLMRALRPRDDAGIEQVVFYDKGVGTGGPIDRIRGGAFGRGLLDNLKDGYRFIANNYAPGDEIYIFGFSRGAFTARSLAGLIGWLGLLHKNHLEHLSAGVASYRNKDAAARDQLRKHYAWTDQVRIRCVGVWDTVGALGIPLTIANAWNRRKYAFHDVQLGDHIDFAFHALAIDEARAPFSPTLWTAPAGSTLDPNRVKQVWFAGVHADVGGGYAEHGLADIALCWMIEEVARATGLCFDAAYLRDHLKPDPLAPQHDSIGWYLASRALPYRRVLGGCDGFVQGLARRLGRFYRPPQGQVPMAEAIHASAVARFGQQVEVRSGKCTRRIRYEPANLAAALEKLPVVGKKTSAK